MGNICDADLPAAPPGAAIDERMIDVPGGSVFAKRVDGGGGGVPLVCLHGGPGFPSYYLEPLTALAAMRPVILYDQLGCGRSERPASGALWTIERFADELDAVLSAYDYPAYHLYGHSWGTMLATRYVSRHGAGKIASITMSSPALKTLWWERDTAALLAALAPEHGLAVAAANASGVFEGPAYEAAHHAFYLRHVCKRGMATELFQRTVREAGLDVYLRIQGSNEFTVTGDMKHWDFTPELFKLDVPVLYLTGDDDEARPETVAAFARMTPGAEMVVVPDAAHLTMLDNAADSNAAVAGFLARVDAGRSARIGTIA